MGRDARRAPRRHHNAQKSRKLKSGFRMCCRIGVVPVKLLSPNLTRDGETRTAALAESPVLPRSLRGQYALCTPPEEPALGAFRKEGSSTA